MQAYIYLIVILVTLQSSVKVAGIKTTEQATTTTRASLTHKTNDAQQQIHLDNSLITNSDSKQIDEHEMIEVILPSEPADRETQLKVEQNLLTLFGRSKRPQPIDRSKIMIPESLKQLYAEIMGEELRETVNLPKPGLHTKSANTVRSFTHEGIYQINRNS